MENERGLWDIRSMENESGSNIVYILINGAMPGYVKIGIAKNLKARMKSLYRTPVPLPFECFYACRVNDGPEVERWLFNVFADRRVSNEREFFEIEPERVSAALRVREIEEVTPKDNYTESEEDVRALEKVSSRREKFNFKMVEINPGETLQFSMDELITCKVLDNHYVEFNNQKLSLTAAAKQVLESKGIHWQAVSGPGIWKFGGETLHQRRLRMEEE